MTRDEHLAWAKARAREYLDRGDNPRMAITSLLSDLSKHEQWAGRPGSELSVLLLRAFLADPSTARARQLIDRFGELNTTRLPVDHCPWCGQELDAASPLDGKATPKPRDILLCISCASVLELDADLRLQKITDAAVREALSAEAYERLMLARRGLLTIDRREPGQRGEEIMPAFDRLAYTGACRPSRRRRCAHWRSGGMRVLVALAGLATIGVLVAVARVFL